MEKDSGRITKLINIRWINITGKEKDDWKKIVKNNLTIVLNVFYSKIKKIYPVPLSK